MFHSTLAKFCLTDFVVREGLVRPIETYKMAYRKMERACQVKLIKTTCSMREITEKERACSTIESKHPRCGKLNLIKICL